MDALPALRNVDAVPVTHEGEKFVCLYDSSGYVDAQILLSPPAYFVAACLDGFYGIAEVQTAFEAQFPGARVSAEKILEIIEYLDTQGFLKSPRFEALRDAVDQAFLAAPTRVAHFAGRSYPEDPDELRAMVDGFFTGDDAPAGVQGDTAPEASPIPWLVVPHIDFERGAPAYAHGYAALRAQGRPDTVLLFGVAHAYAPAPFILTRKDFETPLGRLRTDQAAVEALAAACDGDPFALEGLHRTEHSLEFQAVMLAYLYGEDVKIIPVLCGSFGDVDGATPAAQPAVQRFLEACAALVNDPARRIAVVAGADLAHVGRRFGDPYDIDDTVRGVIEARDRQDLAAVERCAPEDWYASVLQDRNARQVCGLNCIYAALKAASGRAETAKLLYYGAAPDPAGGLVSFASLAASAAD